MPLRMALYQVTWTGKKNTWALEINCFEAKPSKASDLLEILIIWIRSVWKKAQTRDNLKYVRCLNYHTALSMHMQKCEKNEATLGYKMPPMLMNKTLHNITLNSDLEKSATKPAKPTHLFFVYE